MIVIDVGCGRYGGDYSIERLIEEFCPDILYGFDPNVEGIRAALAEGEAVRAKCDTKVNIEATAAWTYDGEIGYVDDGLNSWITDRTEEPRVKCFDLAGFICDVDSRHVHVSESPAIILKMDAEGSEYELLERLIETGHDRWLKLAWVEWHAGPENAEARRKSIEERIACEIVEWRF